MNDPALLMAFIDVESSFNAKAFLNDRNGGSYGLMQLDLVTAQDRGYKGDALGLYDPATNIKYGCAVLDWITSDLTKFGMYSVDNLAAAYNSGLSHVLGGGADAPYAAKIATALAKWRAIFPPAPLGGHDEA